MDPPFNNQIDKKGQHFTAAEFEGHLLKADFRRAAKFQDQRTHGHLVALRQKLATLWMRLFCTLQATATRFAFGYIVMFVTVIAFFLYLCVLGRWTASGASYGFVLIPLITVILATSIAGEQITASFVGGALLVLLGVWFGALLPDKRRPLS